ncbi:hypothetical protein H6P81_012296 [Aristolochia fimbriata]|uniref:Uncharacterized protein n=1 Tax=Aristolochia fimbriata TaxID=158543 RepID=A0AAV7EBI8_ARIFI|nr:hypothetical protein H6P81_012296 [Aristolochia fimbriata]
MASTGIGAMCKQDSHSYCGKLNLTIYQVTWRKYTKNSAHGMAFESAQTNPRKLSSPTTQITNSLKD